VNKVCEFVLQRITLEGVESHVFRNHVNHESIQLSVERRNPALFICYFEDNFVEIIFRPHRDGHEEDEVWVISDPDFDPEDLVQLFVLFDLMEKE